MTTVVQLCEMTCVSRVRGNKRPKLQEMSLKKVMRECASHTSLKGVARILKSDSAILKGLWLFGVVLFLMVCGLQCYDIIQEYLSYPVITTISDKDVVFAGENADLFPNIGICNLSPFSSEAKNIEDIISVEEYLKLVVEAKMEAMNKTNLDPTNQTETILNFWNSPEGYFNYLGFSKARRLGHQPEVFIAKCTIINYFGSTLYQKPCGNLINITTRVNGHFLQCTEIKVPKTTPYVYGISLVLYTDGFKDPFHFKDWGTYHSFDTGVGTASGASLALYHPKTEGLIKPADVIYVNPGEATDVRFKYNTITKLEKPYGICNKTAPQRGGMIYTREACLAKCQGWSTMANCGCIDTIVPYFLESYEMFLPYCMSMKNGIEGVNSNINCMMWSADIGFQSCVERCQVPCITHEYPASIASTKWPKPSQYKAFYQSNIADKPYAWRFAELEQDCHIETSNCTLQQISRQQYLIDNRFAKVNIILGDHRHTFITDHPQISLSSLLAKLGGTLNLWSGITVVIIIEFVDFLLKLVLTKSKNFINKK